MFSLNPNGGSGGDSSSGGPSSGWAAWKSQCYFFGKLATYFVSLRLVHVFWGGTSGSPKAIEN